MDEKLRLTNVSKRFVVGTRSVVALERVDLTVQRGEFVTLVGPSGCGKSTLFNIVVGLLPPDPGGVIHLDGAPQGDLLGKIAFMPQRDLLLPWRTVLDNAVLAMEIQGERRAAARRRAEALFAEFGLQGFEHHYPQQLSGGMRQRVALMRTFLFDRDVMLLDEPFGALDALTRAILQRWLLEVWSKFQRTILFVTHDVDEAIFLGDRVLIMTARPGRIKLEVPVTLPRPRDPSMVTTPEFMALKRRVLDAIEQESLKSFLAAGNGDGA
jgi:ABC-type nitrate/sulfonate/bicarbonate transport system ATPase subunit